MHISRIPFTFQDIITLFPKSKFISKSFCKFENDREGFLHWVKKKKVINSSRIWHFFAGFGDAVDNSNCWDPVISFVESQYEAFLDGETRVHRKPLPDARVHACLYFIAPSGHGLKPLDVEFMKRLHDKVNVIPVIGKFGKKN